MKAEDGRINAMSFVTLCQKESFSLLSHQKAHRSCPASALLDAAMFVQEFRIFVKTPKRRQTRARLGNVELADEAELVSLAVG